MARPRFFVLPLLGLLACDSAPAIPKAPPPPPFPGLSARPAPAELPAEQPAQVERKPHEMPETREAPLRAAKHASTATPPAKTPAAAKSQAAPPKAPAAVPSAPAPKLAAAPAPIIATTPKAEVVTKVSVPKTVHVQLDIPAGLQADLNHDPRMQPWVNQVIATIDRCYGSESKSNAKLAGTIEVLVTMHENERPDADIKQLPPALSPIVACATGGLMRTKMPLFTSKEGTRYTVRLRFSP